MSTTKPQGTQHTTASWTQDRMNCRVKTPRNSMGVYTARMACRVAQMRDEPKGAAGINGTSSARRDLSFAIGMRAKASRRWLSSRRLVGV